jgi:hypothetical protein
MTDSYGAAQQRMQTLNQFMNQVTPQLQQLGVDRSGYKGYAQAYQSAVNNNLAIPQDFADLMYQYGGYGNTGKQLFEPSKDGNPKLTQEGIAYASRNLPEGVALHQGFFDFGKQVSDLAKSKGDNTRYKTLQQQINAAAGYGMEIPQHIQDLAYAGGFGGTPDAQALYKEGFSGGQKLFNPREGKGGVLTDAGKAYASQNLPEGMSLSDAFFNYDKGSYDFLTQQGATDIPRSIPERAKIAEAAGYQTPQYIKDMLYAAGPAPAQTSNNAAPTPTPAAATPTAIPAASDDYFDAEKFKKVQATLGSDVSKVDIDKAVDYFKKGGTHSLEDFQNYMGSDAEQKETAPQGSSNAPEFLANFKKRLQEKAASDTPAIKGGTYAEVTGDTSTKGGRDRSSKGKPSRGSRRTRGVFDREPSQKYRDSMARREAKYEAQRRDADRAASRGRADYESRRSSSRRGTDFGPGRARRDVSGSSQIDSRRDRSFERRGRPFRNRFGR